MGAEERCLMCGAIIPEGRQVCPSCEEHARNARQYAQHGVGEAQGNRTGKSPPKRKNGFKSRSELFRGDTKMEHGKRQR